MSCISELSSYPKCYLLTTLFSKNFLREKPIFVEEYLRMKDLGTRINNCFNLISNNCQRF